VAVSIRRDSVCGCAVAEGDLHTCKIIVAAIEQTIDILVVENVALKL
jgi:hypothetical protein